MNQGSQSAPSASNTFYMTIKVEAGVAGSILVDEEEDEVVPDGVDTGECAICYRTRRNATCPYCRGPVPEDDCFRDEDGEEDDEDDNSGDSEDGDTSIDSDEDGDMPSDSEDGNTSNSEDGDTSSDSEVDGNTSSNSNEDGNTRNSISFLNCCC